MMLGLYTKVRTMWAGVTSRLVDERGVVSTEYGLLLVLIALAIVAAATALGLAITGIFDKGATQSGGVRGWSPTRAGRVRAPHCVAASDARPPPRRSSSPSSPRSCS